MCDSTIEILANKIINREEEEEGYDIITLKSYKLYFANYF